MTRILVVDNYDSFVFTIVGYLNQLGAETEVVRAGRDGVVASVDAYGTGLAPATAATIGTVAWPPQVTMFRFGAARWLWPFTGGMT